jgi:small neutral amino acid transporter SnatA (MarC family)
MKANLRIILGFLGSAMVILGLLAYLAASPVIGMSELLLVFATLLLVGGAVKILLDLRKNVKAGLPLKDEFSKRVEYKAGYYAFFVALYTAVFLPIIAPLIARFFGIPEPGISAMSGIIVFLSGLTFIGSYLYMSRKGNVE